MWSVEGRGWESECVWVGVAGGPAGEPPRKPGQASEYLAGFGNLPPKAPLPISKDISAPYPVFPLLQPQEMSAQSGGGNRRRGRKREKRKRR